VGLAPSLSLRFSLLLLLVIMAAILAWPLRAADTLKTNSNTGAALALARYSAGQEATEPWTLETIEIEASLPKLAKKGRLRAIRRLLPLDRPDYQVLEITGDQTVKQQLIVRYLKAEERASEIHGAEVAVTPENYKFNYKGTINDGNNVVYVFQIIPRRKREGLIKGVLWLDGKTGVPIRQSGYLVKGPSIFVKRVDVTRETSLRDGMVEARITHLSVDTRLIGRAELVIEERPFSTAESMPSPGVEEH
jgi:hypothetical protein